LSQRIGGSPSRRIGAPMNVWPSIAPWRAALATAALVAARRAAVWACLCLGLVGMPSSAQTTQHLTTAVRRPKPGAMSYPVERAADDRVPLPDDWADLAAGPPRPGVVPLQPQARRTARHLTTSPPSTSSAPAATWRSTSTVSCVHSAGHADDTPPQNCGRPQLITLPSALLAAPGQRARHEGHRGDAGHRRLAATGPADCRRSRSVRCRPWHNATRGRPRSTSRHRRRSAQPCC
jgi:hypothetical protein